jgi:NAD(P)-dependent dehydrogenase (short-subunit alcohol dehydrogenase family)
MKPARLAGRALLFGAGLAAYEIWRHWPRRSIEERVVLITGGSRGLGLELARQFAAGGANVALCARNRNELEQAQEKLALEGHRASVHIADVGDQAAMERVVAEVLTRWGGLDILVNNAAAFIAGPMVGMQLEDYRRTFEVNVLGTIAVTNTCRPHLRRRHGGVITIVSAVGLIPAPHVAAYAVSKAALSMYAQLMDVAMADKQLTTMAVYPSYMPTGFMEHNDMRGEPEAERRALRRVTRLPLLAVSPSQGAANIIQGWREGRRVLIYPPLARLGVAVMGAAPTFMLWLARRANRQYPAR